MSDEIRNSGDAVSSNQPDRLVPPTPKALPADGPVRYGEEGQTIVHAAYIVKVDTGLGLRKGEAGAASVPVDNRKLPQGGSGTAPPGSKAK
jgi:hypothetical protein